MVVIIVNAESTTPRVTQFDRLARFHSKKPRKKVHPGVHLTRDRLAVAGEGLHAPGFGGIVAGLVRMALPVSETEHSGGPSIRVLVVDDEVNLRYAIERGLRKAGHQADSASTVRQAIERLRGSPYDIVVSDLRMPGGHGNELIQWLGSHSPSTKIIVVSAFVTPEFRSEHKSSGLRIMEKPVDLDVLIQTIQELGPRKGFFGNAIEVELFDYVQMVALSGRDKLIVIDTPDGQGTVWFEHGDISHVVYGKLSGEKAFYKMLSMGGGAFKELFFHDPPARTIVGSSMHLLMEAARQMDEGILGDEGGEEEPHDEETSFADLGDDDDDEAASEPMGAPVDDDDDVLPPLTDDDDEEQVTKPHAVKEEDWGIPADDEEIKPSAPPKPSKPAPAEAVAAAAATATPATRRAEPAVSADASATALNLLDDPETRELMLGQFFQFEGVNGVAIISSTGKVLAEDMRSNTSLVTLAGFYMRGAARIARSLGYGVFDGVSARSVNGQQLLMVSMGATSAVLSVEIGCDPEEIRQEIMGA